MDSVLTSIGVLLTATAFGGMVFFSACMAPLIFIELNAETAGRFIRRVFPWYYIFVFLLSALAALCIGFQAIPEAIALAAVALTTLLARQILMPAISRAQDASSAGDRTMRRRFKRLHRLSVWLNAAQVIVLGVVLTRMTLSSI